MTSCPSIVAAEAQDRLAFSLDDMKSRCRRGPLDATARLQALDRLEAAIRRHEEAVIAALHADLGKPRFESLSAEVAFLYDEIRLARRNLARWMRPTRVSTPLVAFPASSKLYRDPLGVVLILGAWNYPFQLLVGPLVAALAAGNRVVVKPSELAPATAEVIGTIVREAFAPDHVVAQQGGPDVAARLTAMPFDHIFFTGSAEIGKRVLAAAAANLTPVTLELGGKCPAVVHHTADLRLAAERIVWGANLNAGQTCVRPDYVIVDERVKGPFIEELRRATRLFYGEDPSRSPDLARIVNNRHFDRLVALLGDGTVVIGGAHDRATRFIAPTFLTDVTPGSPLLTQEIFGPLTPILTFDGTVDEVAYLVGRSPEPLALYCFTNDRTFSERIVCRIPFGGGAVNDVVMQLQNHDLPFGGIGRSGMGSYHGEAGFRLFTHEKPVLEDHGSILGPLLRPLGRFRFPPYSWLQEWFFRLIGG